MSRAEVVIAPSEYAQTVTRSALWETVERHLSGGTPVVLLPDGMAVKDGKKHVIEWSLGAREVRLVFVAHIPPESQP